MAIQPTNSIRYVKVYAFGNVKEIERLRKCLIEICDKNKEVGGIAIGNFKEGIDFDRKSSPPHNPFKVSFNHFETKAKFIGSDDKYFTKFMEQFPELAFIGIESYFWAFRCFLDKGTKRLEYSDYDCSSEKEMCSCYAQFLYDWLFEQDIVTQLGWKDKAFCAGLIGFFKETAKNVIFKGKKFQNVFKQLEENFMDMDNDMRNNVKAELEDMQDD